jgi:hypothetical protein
MTTIDNETAAKLTHAVRELARVQRAVCHVLRRTVHNCPETSELEDFAARTINDALAALGVEA